jgi:type II secretory pathway component PulM
MVLAWIGVALLLVVAVIVWLLLDNVRRPIAEIDQYTQDILASGMSIASNLEGVEELRRTHALATAVPGLAVAYLTKLGLVES